MEPQIDDPLTSEAQSRFSYGPIIVAAIFLIQLVVFSISDSFGVLVNPWIEEFGWTRGAISGAYSLGFFVSGILGIAAGMVTDKYGPRLAISICAVLLGVGLILVSRMQELWQLYVFYGLVFGAGMSGIWAPLLSLVSRWFATNRGMITGIVVSGGGLGAFIGPPAITWLISSHGWRQAILALGVFISTIVLVASQFLRRDRSAAQHLPNAASAPASLPVELTGGYSIGEALATAQFWTVFSMLFCLSFYTFSVLVHYVPHLIQLDLAKYSAAYVLSTISGVSILGNWVMGRVGDRLGPKNVFIISFALMSGAIFWLIGARAAWMFYLFSIVFGFNHGGNATAQAPLVARIFGLRAHGTVFAAASFGFTLGGATGPLATGYIFDSTGNYTLAWIVCGTVGLLGLALTLVLRLTQRNTARS